MMLFKNLVMQCDVILMIFAYQTKLNISGRKRATSFLPKRLYDHFDLCNEMKRRLGEISCHKHSNLMLLVSHFLSSHGHVQYHGCTNYTMKIKG
jgi:hypothetical protein